jgi:hypothetical protein
MLRFREVKVVGFTVDALTITWAIDPVDPSGYDPLDVQFTVLRSGSPEGPFDLLTPTPLVDAYVFQDTSLNRRSFWRKFYYKIVATKISTLFVVESVVHRAEVSPTTRFQMLEALEIVRLERLLLAGIGITAGYVGTPCLTFVRKTFGQRCAECFDFSLGRSLLEKCTRCFNTRHVGGYHTPMLIHYGFSPSPKVLEIANFGEVQPSEVDCWTSNYPILSPGDLLVEPNNRRWKVERIHPTERLRVPIRQICRLSEINRSDVEYLVPVQESQFTVPEFKTLMSNNIDFEKDNA